MLNLQLFYDKQRYLEQFVRENIGMSEEEFSSVPMVDQRVFAFKVEFAEFANETAWFKYWKQSHVIDRANTLEELADCVHFIVAIGLYRNYHKFVKLIDHEPHMKLPEAILYHEIMQNPIQSSSQWKKAFEMLLAIGAKLNYTLDEIEAAYLAKNQKNIERQIQKY